MVRNPDNGSVAAPTKSRRSVGRSKAAPKRDSVATRERILQVALTEFAAHGYSGGRIDRIPRSARINVRMIYHYFGQSDERRVGKACVRKFRSRVAPDTLTTNE